MARFQYFSDLHLEFHAGKPGLVDRLWDTVIRPVAPYLLIAGDLGNARYSNYRRFLERASAAFEFVFLVAGNHEYYDAHAAGDRGGDCKKEGQLDAGPWMAEKEAAVREAAKNYPNVVYLQNQAFRIPRTNVEVYGTTLWSDVAPGRDLAIQAQVSDYEYIPHFTPAFSRELFRANEAQLRLFLEQHEAEKVVVVTHHLPSYSLIGMKHVRSELNSAYASEISFRNKRNIAAWVAGHTHTPIESGVFHVNPIGYQVTPQADFGKTFDV